MTALENLLKELEEKANAAQPVALHTPETGIFSIQENTVITDKDTIKKLIAVIRRMQRELNNPILDFHDVQRVINSHIEAALEDCEKIIKGE